MRAWPKANFAAAASDDDAVRHAVNVPPIEPLACRTFASFVGRIELISFIAQLALFKTIDYQLCRLGAAAVASAAVAAAGTPTRSAFTATRHMPLNIRDRTIWCTSSTDALLIIIS